MKTYKEINLKNIKLSRKGKVRDIFDLRDKLLIVASDRISAFDVVLPNTIPYKGRILNSLSVFWFKKLNSITPNHFITDNVNEFPIELTSDEKEMLSGRSSLVQKGKIIEIECVVRGYLDGSGWRYYEKRGKLFETTLPSGLKQGDKLPEPLFTPATKAQTGHDENITFARMKNIIGVELSIYLKDRSIELYNKAHSHALEKGLILADTKFEFAVINDVVKLADEIFTPDSSRFWDVDTYNPGGPQPCFDKEFIRDWLKAQDWDKTPPAPSLPQDIIEKSTEKYLEAYKRIVGKDLV